MSLADRFLYVAGREMSEDGRVGAFSSPAKSPKVKDLTGPFQTRATKKQTGFTEWGELMMTIHTEDDFEALVDKLTGTTLTDYPVMWGEDTDAVGSAIYMGTLLRIAATPKTEPADITEYEVSMVPDEYGFDEGFSLHAMAAEVGDGDTESTPVNNGTMAAAVNISATSEADPTEITTATAHGLTTGDTVLIASDNSTPDLSGSHVVTVTGLTTFTVDVEVTTAGSAGTVTRTSSRNGGVAQVQLSANAPDTATGLVFRVRHSPDGATWATQGTFTTTTTAVASTDPADGNALRLILTGIIDRYAAIAWDFTGTAGTATATFAAGLARNER